MKKKKASFSYLWFIWDYASFVLTLPFAFL